MFEGASEGSVRARMLTEVSGQQMSDEHGATDAHDDQANGSDSLGPIDVQAWGALAVGIALGLVVALCIAASTGAL
jgi:hypothetical protein